MNVKLFTIKDVKDFVDICSKYDDVDITLKQGRYVVDGKSILGIFSLNLLESVNVMIDSKNENSKNDLHSSIQKWKTNND